MWSIKGYLTLLKAIVVVVLVLPIFVADIIVVVVNISYLLLMIPLYLVVFSKCSSETP